MNITYEMIVAHETYEELRDHVMWEWLTKNHLELKDFPSKELKFIKCYLTQKLGHPVKADCFLSQFSNYEFINKQIFDATIDDFGKNLRTLKKKKIIPTE